VKKHQRGHWRLNEGLLIMTLPISMATTMFEWIVQIGDIEKNYFAKIAQILFIHG
jgi:hypothetical protein